VTAELLELRRRIGHPDQLYGTRLVGLLDGGGVGCRAVEVWNAAGLRFDVLVDRGFDVHRAEYRGRAIQWTGPPGLRSRFAYEPQGFGWLRNFHGGLVMTCGLDNVLAPVDRPTPENHRPMGGDVHFGLHGRVANESASLLTREVREEGPDPAVVLRGLVVQAALFGENLWLDRTIEVPLFEPEIHISDTVLNRGFAPTHHELLYHVNLGYPLVDAGTRVEIAEGDELVVVDPEPAKDELVTDHQPGRDADGLARVTVRSTAGLGLELSYSAAPLPFFQAWYMMGEGAYAIGLEPNTVGREPDPEHLTYLEPDQRVSYSLGFRVFEEGG
jgi:hypothetical protein